MQSNWKVLGTTFVLTVLAVVVALKVNEKMMSAKVSAPTKA